MVYSKKNNTVEKDGITYKTNDFVRAFPKYSKAIEAHNAYLASHEREVVGYFHHEDPDRNPYNGQDDFNYYEVGKHAVIREHYPTSSTLPKEEANRIRKEHFYEEDLLLSRYGTPLNKYEPDWSKPAYFIDGIKLTDQEVEALEKMETAWDLENDMTYVNRDYSIDKLDTFKTGVYIHDGDYDPGDYHDRTPSSGKKIDGTIYSLSPNTHIIREDWKTTSFFLKCFDSSFEFPSTFTEKDIITYAAAFDSILTQTRKMKTNDPALPALLDLKEKLSRDIEKQVSDYKLPSADEDRLRKLARELPKRNYEACIKAYEDGSKKQLILDIPTTMNRHILNETEILPYKTQEYKDRDAHKGLDKRLDAKKEDERNKQKIARKEKRTDTIKSIFHAIVAPIVGLAESIKEKKVSEEMLSTQKNNINIQKSNQETNQGK